MRGEVVLRVEYLMPEKLLERALNKGAAFREVRRDGPRALLIQCDAAVQEDTVIRSPEDLDPVLAGLSLRGFGGTDFRPAFEYTDQLLREGTFQDLQGLIYFTDGDGIYPEEMPDYKAAFVFLEDQYEDRDVPVWAIKIILEKDEGQL